MMCIRWSLIVLALLAAATSCECRDGLYTNQWAVQVNGGVEVAKQLAEKHGFSFVATVRIATTDKSDFSYFVGYFLLPVMANTEIQGMYMYTICGKIFVQNDSACYICIRFQN